MLALERSRMPHPQLAQPTYCGALGTHAHAALPYMGLRPRPIAAGQTSHQIQARCASHTLLPLPRQQRHRCARQRLPHITAASIRSDSSSSSSRDEEAAALDSSTTTEAASGSFDSLRLAHS